MAKLNGIAGESSRFAAPNSSSIAAESSRFVAPSSSSKVALDYFNTCSMVHFFQSLIIAIVTSWWYLQFLLSLLWHGIFLLCKILKISSA